MAATDLKFVDPSNTIEFQRQKINEIAADIHSAFTGTASLNVGRIQIAGADIGVVSDQVDKVVFFYFGGFATDRTVQSPGKFAEVFTHVDATVDIDDTVNVDVNDSCVLSLTDTVEYLFFSNDTEKTNLPKLNDFADNVRTTFENNITLSDDKKVGYIILPSEYRDDCPIDIEDSIEVSIGDQAVLIV
tara:strand:+ start:57 stop:620 length:564 start_codon:yes stop_codon:yes gene_type:complete